MNSKEMKAKDIMTKEVITVNKGATIEEITKTLVNNNISGVPVVDNAGKLVGIVTEDDLLNKELSPRLPFTGNILGAFIYYSKFGVHKDDWNKIMAVEAFDLMTDKVITIDEDAEIEKISRLMLEHNIKRIPVVKGGTLIGIVSRKDIVKTLIKI